MYRIIIEPRSGFRLVDWKELLEYKDLFYFLVWKDIKVLYKQTILGFLWAILRPLLSMFIFTIVFGKMAKMPSDGVPYPIFTYTALVPWIYFSTAMMRSTQSLVTNAHILTKVYFPRIIIPLTPVLAGLIEFIIAMSILALFMLFYGICPNANIIFLPYLITLMILTSAGIGMCLSAMAVQYRDVAQAIQFLAQILMYAAPVVWPVSLIPEQYQVLYGLYPMVGVIEGFRAALLGTTAMPWSLILMGTIMALVVFITGAFYFRRMERNFADVA
jgi:lipopolysaccharide transport system permease protein